MPDEDSTELIEVTYGSYKLSDATFEPIDSTEPVVCLALETFEMNEAVLFLTKIEAQQLITNIYKQLNQLG